MHGKVVGEKPVHQTGHVVKSEFDAEQYQLPVVCLIENTTLLAAQLDREHTQTSDYDAPVKGKSAFAFRVVKKKTLAGQATESNAYRFNNRGMYVTLSQTIECRRITPSTLRLLQSQG